MKVSALPLGITDAGLIIWKALVQGGRLYHYLHGY
jgi:hypothetical protein